MKIILKCRNCKNHNLMKEIEPGVFQCTTCGMFIVIIINGYKKEEN